MSFWELVSMSRTAREGYKVSVICIWTSLFYPFENLTRRKTNFHSIHPHVNSSFPARKRLVKINQRKAVPHIINLDLLHSLLAPLLIHI